MKHFIFTQIDSWFFRESRSMDGAGSTALESVFPPPSKTLLGAIRAQIGNAFHKKHKTTWNDFKKNTALKKNIGYGSDDYADLEVQGAWLYKQSENQCYFPCPMNLLKQGDKETGFFTLSDKPIHCDLGKVCLPQLDRDKLQSSIENAYLSATAFTDVLNGKVPKPDKLVEESNIITKEYRLGIARDNYRRKTEDGKLYQTNHLRLDNDWQIYLALDGVEEDSYLPSNKIMRLGGEARMAVLNQIPQPPKLPQKPQASKETTQLIIYLVTPLPDFSRDNLPALPNTSFSPIDDDSHTVWQGKILEKDIKIISAITGKPIRIGGWDMVEHQSLPVRSFIPAGSCWYIETDNAQAIIDALHAQFLTIGSDRALGYGQMFVGIAPMQPTQK